MKKLFLFLFSFSFLVSCSLHEQADLEVSKDNNLELNSEILTELSSFNDSLASTKKVTRGIHWKTVGADAKGAWRGGKWGASIGTKIGAMSGMPQYGCAAGAVCGGLIGAALSSYIAEQFYTKTEVVQTSPLSPLLLPWEKDKKTATIDNQPWIKAEDFFEFSETIEPIVLESIDNLNLDSLLATHNNPSDLNNATKDETESVFDSSDNKHKWKNTSEDYEAIRQALKEKEIEFSYDELAIGNLHNIALKAKLSSDSNTDTVKTTRNNNVVKNDTEEIPSISTRDFLKSHKFKEELYSSLNNMNDVDAEQEKADKVFNLFDEICSIYVNDDDDLITVIKKYNDVISKSKELDDNEKKWLKYGLVTSIYSFNFWYPEKVTKGKIGR